MHLEIVTNDSARALEAASNQAMAQSIHIAGMVDRPVLLSAEGLTRFYRRGAETVRALDGVSFELRTGEMAAIVGPSGAGKSTLLHLVGCMDAPTAGTLTIDGRSTVGLNDYQLTRMRRDLVGFVFQQFGLLPTLTVAENVVLPTLFSRKIAANYAVELLDRVGMAQRATHRPYELSGGEMQRVAIARSLVNSPRLLLADEPTGNLDTANGESILQLFSKLNSEGLTVLVVTHNESLAQSIGRQLCLADGKLVSDLR